MNTTRTTSGAEIEKKNTEFREKAGNAPQIVGIEMAGKYRPNAESLAGSGNAAKFEPFTPNRRSWYIEKWGIDPDAIRETPEELSSVQLRELLEAVWKINTQPMVSDLCTPSNAAWVFAVLDRVAAEIFEYRICQEPGNSYPFLLSMRLGVDMECTPELLYKEINDTLERLDKGGAWETMIFASFVMEELFPREGIRLIVDRYKAYVQRVAAE